MGNTLFCSDWETTAPTSSTIFQQLSVDMHGHISGHGVVGNFRIWGNCIGNPSILENIKHIYYQYEGVQRQGGREPSEPPSNLLPVWTVEQLTVLMFDGSLWKLSLALYSRRARCLSRDIIFWIVTSGIRKP